VYRMFLMRHKSHHQLAMVHKYMFMVLYRVIGEETIH
jgi:hypothetical protein